MSKIFAYIMRNLGELVNVVEAAIRLAASIASLTPSFFSFLQTAIDPKKQSQRQRNKEYRLCKKALRLAAQIFNMQERYRRMKRKDLQKEMLARRIKAYIREFRRLLAVE